MKRKTRKEPSLLGRSLIATLAVGLAAVFPHVAPAADAADAQPAPAPSAITFSVVYDGEALVNATGGLRTGAVYLGTLRLPVTVDGERLLGWPGMTFFVEALAAHGGHPSRRVGDAQGVSNLEAPAGAQLYEAWIQQNLLGNRVSVLLGRYDLNSELYRLQSAGLFLNSSFGVGPEFSQSGSGGPSIYPDTAVGARLAFKPTRDVVLRAAVLDGVPVERPGEGARLFARGDGELLVAEAAFLRRSLPDDGPRSSRFRIGRSSGLRPYDGKLALGGWYYTAPFDDLSERGPAGGPVRHRGSGGVYGLADEPLYQSATQPGRQVHAFLQSGCGDSRVNRFGFYFGGGLVVSGLLPALANDELGLAVALARNGSHFLDRERQDAVPVTGTETALELTYLLQVGKHLALQPDLQYVLHPGTDPRRKNALAVALRFELSD
jgi:porin